MKTSKQGIELIKSFEGLRLRAYVCPAGVATIGWGHTKGVKAGMVIDLAEAERMLADDIAIAERCVNCDADSLNQNQFDALVSFVFNVGTANYKKSTLRKKVLANPNDPAIADEFGRWKYANKIVLPGLVRRRKAESDLYFSKSDVI